MAMASAGAQVTNYALEFDADGTVDCGQLSELDCRENYMVQMWICPSEWTPGAVLLSRGDGFSVSLGQPGTVNFNVGGSTVTADNVPAGEWSLLSLRTSGGKTYVNGKRNSIALGAVPASVGDASLTLGGGYSGRLDEIRIWGEDTGSEFDYFEHTTLNRYNPGWDDLLVYYKMDQELCDHLVDYKSIYSPDAAWNHHGVMSATGVRRVQADNPALPYLTNSAYTANERFYDRAIPRDQYLFANDLIILGIESKADGHVRTCTPNNHATLNGTAEWMAEYEGREGVMAFDGEGWLETTEECMRSDANAYTFESWLYVDEWVEGAYIFRKETEDGLNGFSISLGREANHEIVVRVNGNKFVNQRNMKAGQWIHMGLSVEGGGQPYNTFVWVYNGKTLGQGSSACDRSTDYKPVGNDTIRARIGEGFIGKIDDFTVWDTPLGRGGYENHMHGLPMPGLNKVVSSDLLQRANTLYEFNDAGRPGWSSYSQDNWREIMQAAYEGHRGFQTRISVKSHNNWQGTISSSARRKIFAADLARLSEGYDGVELDLEWMYGTQTSLGLLAEEIRAALPEGKSLMISCHNVAYQFPKNKMDFCDGFTFQQYGPQKDHSYFSHFKSMTQNFIDYGFPREKILCSYATTTSEGHINGQRPANAPPIKGVKDGFMEEGFVPDGEIDYGVVGNYTYYFDGPLQTYKRARYVTDERLGGIFYWDMGNDVRPEHPYNLAKWSTYGLNANVDTLVTNVEVRHFTAIDGVERDSTPQLTATVADGGNTLLLTLASGDFPLRTVITAMDGRLAAEYRGGGGRADISALPAGHYVVTVYTTDRVPKRARFVRK